MTVPYLFSSLRRSNFLRTSITSLAVLLLASSFLHAQTPTPTVSPSASPTPSPAPAFTNIIVFGDSLSDIGNIAHRTNDKFQIRYPGGSYNYSDGRFTNSSDTDPGSAQFVGVWHEQLQRKFLKIAGATNLTNSLDGGTDYAFGGATTSDGTSERTVISNPEPFAGGNLTLTIDNMGKQLDDYLNNHTVDPGALYIVWGGGNDLFDNDSDANVSATAARVANLVSRLANAGARNILVPNVPPLGAIPHYVSDNTKSPELDAASSSYRQQLDSALNGTVISLAAFNINIQLYRLDVWSMFIRLTAEPAKYGFTDIRHSAQGQNVNVDKYLFWDDIHPTTAGHFQIATEANRVLSSAAIPPGKALNVSTRLSVGTSDSVAIVGFIITGDNSKRVIVRALGPSLSDNGVTGALADPTLTLFDKDMNQIAINDNWKDTQQTEITATTLAPKNDFESAIVQTLAPGKYTAVLSGRNSTSGVGLVEAFDLDSGGNSTLANLSTRGFVGTGENVLIGGFIVGSGGDPIVVVRAIGPSLMGAGVGNPLQDPTLELHDANGALVSFDDNWRDSQSSAIRATGLAPTDDRESVIVASLPSGNYTAIVRGKADATGVALVEAYRIQ